MTRNLHQWRIQRLLAIDPCECGNVPRVGIGKGCARCEGMDRQRYQAERMVDVVRRNIARFDLVSSVELAAVCNATARQMTSALRHLMERGEIEAVGESTATEYRKRRAA